jgi:predicted small secreted protein
MALHLRGDFMKTKMKTFVILMTALITVAASGCRHTARGIGEDMERAGDKIQDTVDR